MKKSLNPVIFIVDENTFYAKIVQQYLNIADYSETLIFKGTTECIKYLDIQPDIIVAEYQYSDCQKQGLGFLEIVKAISPETETIFLTSNSNVETAIQAIRAGATDYIIKSVYAPDKLLHTMNSVINFKKELIKNNTIGKKLLASVGFLLILMGCLVFFYTH